MPWLDRPPLVLAPAHTTVHAVPPGVLASMPTATLVAEPQPPPPACRGDEKFGEGQCFRKTSEKDTLCYDALYTPLTVKTEEGRCKHKPDDNDFLHELTLWCHSPELRDFLLSENDACSSHCCCSTGLRAIGQSLFGIDRSLITLTNIMTYYMPLYTIGQRYLDSER